LREVSSVKGTWSGSAKSLIRKELRLRWKLNATVRKVSVGAGMERRRIDE